MYYILYIILFVILLLCLSICSYKESFVTNDYSVVNENGIPSDTSCIRLAIEKGLYDPNETDENARRRKAVLADLETARVPQSLLNSTAYPTIDKCVFNENVLRLYNGIDPQSCLMNGYTVDNQVIYNQLDTIGLDNPIYPKGCSIDMSTIKKQELNKILDDAYVIKNYKELKKIKDDELQIAQLNTQLQIEKDKLARAEAINRQYSDYIDNKTDTIESSCVNRVTPWQENGGWRYNYMDRIPILCGDNEVLNSYTLERHPTLNNYTHYEYKCCKLDTKPVDGRLKEQVQYNETPFKDAGKWDNILNLTDQPIKCNDVTDRNKSMLKGFRLEPQYLNNGQTNNSRYNVHCTTFNTDIINKKLRTSCTKKSSNTFPLSGKDQFDILHNVQVGCNEGEGLKDVTLKNYGTEYKYEYYCCRPEIIPDIQ